MDKANNNEFSVRLTPYQVAILCEIANRHGRSAKGFVRDILKGLIDEYERATKDD